MRIKTLETTLCQLKNNMQDDGGIGWLAILSRRLKTNLFGGLDRVVVKTMTQTADHAYYMQIPRRLQNYFKQNLALNPEAARFLRIDGSRFGDDFRRNRGGGGDFRGMRMNRWWSGHVGITESALLNRIPRDARMDVANGRAIAEACAYHHAASSFSPAASVAVSATGWQIEGSQRGDIDGFPLSAFGGNSVRDREASGLDLRSRARDGGRC